MIVRTRDKVENDMAYIPITLMLLFYTDTIMYVFVICSVVIYSDVNK